MEPLADNDLRVTPLKKDDSVLAMKRAFLKLGVASMADERDDIGVKTHSRDRALRLLKGQVLEAIVDDKKNADKWNFTAVPLECFGKTMDDILIAFLNWSRLEDDDQYYDVSKAFVRLGQYAEWMYTRREELRGLTSDSVQPGRKAWNMMASRDKLGRVVWWLDLASVEGLKELTAKDSLRFFVWFTHYLIFRHQTQHHGVVIVINLAQVDLSTFVSMVPPSLTRKLEHFTIDILPIDTKEMYITGSPRWCNLFMTMIKPFLSEALRRRTFALENPMELNNVLGTDCVPEGFGRSVKEISQEHHHKVQLLTPKEIFRAHGLKAPLAMQAGQGTNLLREWQ